MKKRIIATLLVGAVATAGIVGLSACGNSVSVPKGEEVTAEKWAEAFTSDAYKDMTNYTVSSSSSIQSSAKGKVTVGTKTEEASTTVKTTTYSTTLYDEDGGYAYSESTGNSSVKTTIDGVDTTATEKASDKTYYQFKEIKNDVKTYYVASYELEESQDNTGHSVSEHYWGASETSSFMYNAASPYLFSGNFQDAKEDEKVEHSGSIAALYEVFSYSGGVYTANLYANYRIDPTHNIYDVIECEVKVSIKDGMVIGYSVKANVTDKFTDEGEVLGTKYAYDIDYTVKVENVIAFTNIGNTNASKKSNNDIKKAIQKYIDENATDEE